MKAKKFLPTELNIGKSVFSKCKYILSLLLLSLLISTCFYSLVNRFTDKLLPVGEVQITVKEHTGGTAGGNDIMIADISPEYKLQDIYNSAEKTGTWEYRAAEKYGYSYNFIVIGGKDEGSSISFKLPQNPSSVVVFYKLTSGGIIQISSSGHTQEINLYSDKTGGDYYCYYPFSNSPTYLAITAFVYILLTAAIFLALNLIIKRLRTIQLKKLLQPYNTLIAVLAIFLLVYIYDVIKYKVGIPNFLAFGDQNYYWNTTQFFQGGILGLEQYSASAITFRGYLSSFVPYLSKAIGGLLSIDPVHVFFGFTSLATALLLGLIIPDIYRVLRGKKAENYQILIFIFVFSFFWHTYYYSILMDLFALTAFFACVMFSLRFFEKFHWVYLGLAGGSLAVACSFRLSYKLALVFLGLSMLIVLFLKLRKRKTGKFQKIILPDKLTWKTYISGLLAFALAFTVVCIPQIVVNRYKGHNGLFAFEEKGWGSEDTTLTEFSANLALNSQFIGYPYPLPDGQSNYIRTKDFPANSYLNLNQILKAYAASPLDTLLVIAKRIIMGFDLKSFEAYPNIAYGFSSLFYFYSFINYFILGSAVFILLNKKLRNVLFAKRELVFWIILTALLILPQTFTHIEWRYYLVGYTFLYYIFSFKFAEVLRNDEVRTELICGNYLPFIGGFEFLYNLISLTMYHAVY